MTENKQSPNLLIPALAILLALFLFIITFTKTTPSKRSINEKYLPSSELTTKETTPELKDKGQGELLAKETLEKINEFKSPQKWPEPEEKPSEETPLSPQENPPASTQTLPEPIFSDVQPDISNPETIRIGFITDLHIDSKKVGQTRQIDPEIKKSVDYFIERMSLAFKPNFIILGGDIIEGTGRDDSVGMEELQLCKENFNRTNLPKYWVAGNHDLRSVEKEQWLSALGINYLYKSFNVGNYKIILLDSNYTNEDKNIKPNRYFTRGNISKDQLKWLDDELESSSKHKVVFVHHPPLTSLPGKSSSGLMLRADEVQKILTENKVSAVFSGHVEALYHKKISGVHYYVVPGTTKHPSYIGAYTEIELNAGNPRVTINYRGSNGQYKSVAVE